MLRSLATFLAVVALSGCGGVAPILQPVESPPAKQTKLLDQRRVLADAEYFADEALRLYHTGDVSRAETITRILGTATEDLGQAVRYKLTVLNTHQALDRNANDAMATALELQPRSRSQRLAALEVWARVLSNQGDAIDALETIFSAKELLTESDARTRDRLNALAWATLTAMLPAQLEELQSETRIEDLRVWSNLAILRSNSLSESSWQVVWENWQQDRLDHESTQWLSAHLNSAAHRTPQIAILLAQSGTDAHTRAAQAIRDGFVLAQLEDGQFLPSSKQPTVSFLDVNKTNVIPTIRQAFAGGKTHIVGPLNKDLVDHVIENGPFGGHLLLLNHPNVTNRLQDTSIRHVGWSIKDEATALAGRVATDESKSCVTLYGSDPWMMRATAEFERALPEKVEVLATHRIPDDASITEVVGDSLGIGESIARHEHLQSVIRYDVEFLPRLNQDVTCVVAFIEGLQLEAVLEALRYHSERSLQVFVTESALREHIPDLAEAVLVTTSPWKVYPELVGDTLNSIQANPNLRSFYAFGMDAYKLVNRWDHLKTAQQLVGRAGRYELSENGEIRRIPTWAIVSDGELVPLRHEQFDREHPYL